VWEHVLNCILVILDGITVVIDTRRKEEEFIRTSQKYIITIFFHTLLRQSWHRISEVALTLIEVR
jgi:hypothetical protein